MCVCVCVGGGGGGGGIKLQMCVRVCVPKSPWLDGAGDCVSLLFRSGVLQKFVLSRTLIFLLIM